MGSRYSCTYWTSNQWCLVLYSASVYYNKAQGKRLFTASFSEGNSLSTLEIKVNKNYLNLYKKNNLEKRVLGFTNGCFDILHPGHIYLLKKAKENCDYLIVGLQFDPSVDRKEKNSPIQTIVERYTQLKGIKYVDEIIPYATEQDLEDILSLYTIDIRILGDEYRDKDFTGRDICRQRDIEIFFNKRDHRFSTSDLRRRVCET